MARPRLRILMRQIHYWSSIAILLTGGLIAVTGFLLLLKKDVDWLQPPVPEVSRTGATSARVDHLFHAASRAAPEPLEWDRIDRIDVRPSKGVAKVITDEASEYQVDLHTFEVVSIGHRGSDVVESIHDGSFFADWVKYFLMIPTAIGLFILWATGLYLFVLTEIKKRAKKKR